MSWLVVLPVILPLGTAVVTLLAWESRRTQRVLSVTGTSAQLVGAIALLAYVWREGIQSVQAGNWAAPFGITFVVDLLSASMVLITGIMGFAVSIYALGSIDKDREQFGFQPLYHFLLMGVNGSFLTGDLFNLYVWFEVMLIASFALLVLGNEKGQVRGGLKYVTINLVSSAFFLTAVGLLYAAVGTLNLADIAARLPGLERPGLVTTLSMLFLVAFGIKAAIFPLFFWLPASYPTPPTAISAIFAGLLTKVGVYALIRVFTLLFIEDVGYTHQIILVIAGFTMVTGVLGAAAQHELRKILSFHIISQIGYMVLGLALFTPLALAGAVFYILHHIIVKTNLFLVSGIARRVAGSFELEHLGGLYRTSPWLAILFVVPAFSLAGFPPLSGFWAKLIVIRAGIEKEEYLIVAVALVVGILTLYSMTKIWAGAFWKALPDDAERSEDEATPSRLAPMFAAVILLASLTVFIGIWAQPLLDLATASAAELLDPSLYIEAVLGGRR